MTNMNTVIETSSSTSVNPAAFFTATTSLGQYGLQLHLVSAQRVGPRRRCRQVLGIREGSSGHCPTAREKGRASCRPGLIQRLVCRRAGRGRVSPRSKVFQLLLGQVRSRAVVSGLSVALDDGLRQRNQASQGKAENHQRNSRLEEREAAVSAGHQFHGNILIEYDWSSNRNASRWRRGSVPTHGATTSVNGGCCMSATTCLAQDGGAARPKETQMRHSRVCASGCLCRHRY